MGNVKQRRRAPAAFDAWRKLADRGVSHKLALAKIAWSWINMHAACTSSTRNYTFNP